VSRESLIFGVAGVFFGVLVGWIIGTQQAAPPRQAAAPAPAAQQQTSAPRQAQTAAPLDEARAATLRQSAERDPRDARVRIELGNVYFDSERFADAARWYEEALKIEPRNVSVSTDLGISYYYMNQPDRALAQFERSLAIDASHTKTLLNVGIVKAFGKQDLQGAARAWQQVIDIAPSSQEAAMARKAIEGVRSAHPEGGTSSPPPAGQPGK
jgi:cytochrome c-type biogenesis protein CcmH/NrfG